MKEREALMRAAYRGGALAVPVRAQRTHMRDATTDIRARCARAPCEKHKSHVRHYSGYAFHATPR